MLSDTLWLHVDVSFPVRLSGNWLWSIAFEQISGILLRWCQLRIPSLTGCFHTAVAGCETQVYGGRICFVLLWRRCTRCNGFVRSAWFYLFTIVAWLNERIQRTLPFPLRTPAKDFACRFPIRTASHRLILRRVITSSKMAYARAE